MFVESLPDNGEGHRVVLLIGAAAIFLPGYALVLRAVSNLQLRQRRSRRARRVASDVQDGESAMAWLQHIWFQRTFSSAWSESVGGPFGLAAKKWRPTSPIGR